VSDRQSPTVIPGRGKNATFGICRGAKNGEGAESKRRGRSRKKNNGMWCATNTDEQTSAMLKKTEGNKRLRRVSVRGRERGKGDRPSYSGRPDGTPPGI